MAKAKTPRKTKQPPLDADWGPPSDPRIDALAERYRAARDEWMSARPEMNAAQDLLMAAMKEAKLTHYETPDGYNVDVVVGEKVSVRKKKEPSDV